MKGRKLYSLRKDLQPFVTGMLRYPMLVALSLFSQCCEWYILYSLKKVGSWYILYLCHIVYPIQFCLIFLSILPYLNSTSNLSVIEINFWNTLPVSYFLLLFVLHIMMLPGLMTQLVTCLTGSSGVVDSFWLECHPLMF